MNIFFYSVAEDDDWKSLVCVVEMYKCAVKPNPLCMHFQLPFPIDQSQQTRPSDQSEQSRFLKRGVERRNLLSNDSDTVRKEVMLQCML